MTMREEYEGFVPVTFYLADHRVEGKVWKFANRRLLQQLEEDKRQFVPVVLAKLFFTSAPSPGADPSRAGHPPRQPAEFDVLAVSKDHIIAIEPKDTVTPRAPR
jgi:hypothetical protein